MVTDGIWGKVAVTKVVALSSCSDGKERRRESAARDIYVRGVVEDKLRNRIWMRIAELNVRHHEAGKRRQSGEAEATFMAYLSWAWGGPAAPAERAA